jgi:translation initiation factor IF-3
MAPEVRVIGPDGEQMGVMSMQDAMRRAADFDVDVVETVATASPPVVRLIDYGKFKYQEQKREAEAKSKQTVIEVKEIKLRPGTDEGDYQVKMRNIKRFLEEGDKVKVTLRFRGREITHQDIGMAQLERIKSDLGDSIVVESMPKLEGKQMIMMIAPSRKKPSAKPANAASPASPSAEGSPAA